MSKRKKNFTITLNVRNFWEIGKGHMSHLSGSGTHDSRPKRQRTRGDSNRKAIRDFS